MNTMIITFAIPVVLILLMNWMMPSVMPATLLFGVRIPPSEAHNKVIVAVRTRYYRWLALITLVVLAAYLMVIIENQHVQVAAAYPWGVWVMAGTLILCYVNYYAANRSLRAAKCALGWYQGQRQVVVAETNVRQHQRASIAWMIPSGVVLIAGFVIGAVKYASLPERFAIHFNLTGAPDEWATKSVMTVFGPLFIGVFVTIVIGFLMWSLSRSAVRVDPDDTAADLKRKQQLQNRIIGLVWLMIAAVDLTLVFVSLSIWGVWLHAAGSAGSVALLPIAACCVMVIIIAVLAIQARHAHERSSGVKPHGFVQRDDDKFWYGGAIYVNKDDPAFLVPKRFGVGWTFNMAHPLGWIILIGIVAIPVFIQLLARATR